jgi:ubiquinone/menaquinone biosynthesis C-methylase UbiE
MNTPDQISYMDAAAATAIGLAYKRRFVETLDIQPGHTVVDLGCGPGTDLARLADAVGPGGSVIGIDRDPRMLAEARHRLVDRPNVQIRDGDLHDLPFADHSVDRARTDRVLQHVEDPAQVLAEIARVLRPGGLVALAEPDWDTLAVADEDIDTSRRYAAFTAAGVRNATIGREAARLCAAARLRVRSIEPIALLYRDFDTADRFLGLRRISERAVADGQLDEAAARAWVARQAAGPVVAGHTFYLVVAEA